MRYLLKRNLFNKRYFHQFSRCISKITNENHQKYEYEYENFRRDWNRLIIGGTVAAVATYKLYDNLCYLKSNSSKDGLQVGESRTDLPTFTAGQVAEHTTKKSGIWVIYKKGVYDITNFVDQHPGGDQLLMAAGSSIEPFWLLYGVHNTEQIYKILESMRIGNVDLTEDDNVVANQGDPYGSDPIRHKALKPTSVKPFNAEPPLSILVDSFLSPNNHLPVPQVDPETYELELEVEGKSKIYKFSLKDLKKMSKHTITATIMCAGNRRSEMTKVKAVKGLDWGAAAVGNAQWSGVRLRDLLKIAGVSEETTGLEHVQFEGLDLDPTGNSYGASIPFWKAVDKRGDVLIAYEMNGVPIPKDHGFPVRVIVPGVVGARNVKWLGRIFVSKEESNSHWQQNDYKGFCPSVDWDNVDFKKSPAIQELPVISAICKPSVGETVKVEDGHILVKGYAWSGGGQKIVRVDVTVDGGQNWHSANIDEQDSAEPPQHWGWSLWSIKIPVPKGQKKIEIWAKAVDSAYNTQPESFKNIWNLRGVLSNAYHRVPINLK